MSTAGTTYPHVRARSARPASRARALDARIEIAGLVALVAGAVVLRVALVDRSLWFDELITVLKARDTAPSLLTGLASDVHPPLYYLLLHLWVGPLGTGAAAMRSLSIVWSIVCVVAVWGWSRAAFPAHSGLPAATLAAFGPFSAWYGSEVRMYAQVLALTALAGWMAWRVLEDGPSRGRVAVLAAALAALAWTHYFASLFIGSLGVVAVAHRLRRREARAGATWVMACCAIAWASLLPWLAFVVERRGATAPDPTHYPVPDFYSVAIAGLEMLVGFPSFSALGVLAAGWPVICLAALVLLPHAGRLHSRTAGLLAVLALPAAVLVSFSVLGPRSVFDPRFLAVCAVPLYVLAGRLLAGLRGWMLGPAVGIVAAGAVGASLWQNTSRTNPKLYDYRQALAAINARARPGDAIMLMPNFAAAGVPGNPVFDYYRPRPGLAVIDTSRIGQATPAGTGRAVRDAWRQVQQMRPARVFTIDAFSHDQERGRRAAATARGFLRYHARTLARVSLPNASVTEYLTYWGQHDARHR
jgi:uncharacterized membrane protein